MEQKLSEAKFEWSGARSERWGGSSAAINFIAVKMNINISFFSIPASFVLINLAMLRGWYRFFTGSVDAVWRSER